MANVKLSQLPVATNPDGTEIIPAVQNGTVGITVAQLRKTKDGVIGISCGDATDMLFYTGAGVSDHGDGGSFNVFLGNGYTPTEGIYGGAGGNFNFYGGTSHSPYRRGGYFFVGGGQSLGYYGNGGYIGLFAGEAPYGYGGSVEINSGDGYFKGGNAEFRAGSGYGYSRFSEGGHVTINAGDGSDEGGNVYIFSGRSDTEAEGATGGNIMIYSSPGYRGGRLYLKAGRGYIGEGGDTSLLGGNNRGALEGGHVYIQGGYTYTGTGGHVFIDGGVHTTETGYNGQIYLRSLPTSDPGFFGALWVDTMDGNRVKQSRPG